MAVFSWSSPERHSLPLHRLPLHLIPATLNPVCVFISHLFHPFHLSPALSFISIPLSVSHPPSLSFSSSPSLSLSHRGCSRLRSCMSEQQTARQQQSAGAASCASPNNPPDKARPRSAETVASPPSLSPSSSLSSLPPASLLLSSSRRIYPSSVLAVDAHGDDCGSWVSLLASSSPILPGSLHSLSFSSSSSSPCFPSRPG